MDPFTLIFLIATIATSVASIGLSAETSKQNKELTEDTNETNLQIAQEANAAQAAESQKAYERSKAGNQVGLLMQAGMSRAGAINSLNNGGSYTPAPVNTAQMQAPQYDSSGIREALSGLTGSMSNVGQMGSLRKQVAMQEQKNNADIDYVKAQTAATESQTAQTNYSFAMQQLTDDMRKQAASISQRVSAADYDTPESYISALKSKCSSTEQSLFDSPQFVQALTATHQLNQTATSTAAGIRNTDANTEHTKTDTKRLKESIKILKNDVYVSDMTYMSEADKRLSENALREIIADSGYQLEYLKYDYLTSDEGKERQEKIESAKKFWELAETRYGIPVKVLVQVAKLVGAIYVGKGIGSSSAASGSIVRQGGYEFIYSN